MRHLFYFFWMIEQATIIDPADVGALESALEKNNVSAGESNWFLFYKVSF